MKKISKTLATFGLSLTVFMSGTTMADDHGSDGKSEAQRELKKEHKEQRREMHRQQRAESMLLRVDANKDGNIDLGEYLAHAEERFNKLDTNSDGFVTTEEAKENMQKMRKQHRERRKEMQKARKESEK